MSDLDTFEEVVPWFLLSDLQLHVFVNGVPLFRVAWPPRPVVVSPLLHVMLACVDVVPACFVLFLLSSDPLQTAVINGVVAHIHTDPVHKLAPILLEISHSVAEVKVMQSVSRLAGY